MARRRGNGFRDFIDGFNSTYDTFNKVARDVDETNIANDKVVEENTYAPADEFDTGGGITGTKYTYDGKSYDKPISESQLDGLRAARFAKVAEKYGDFKGAMSLRRDVRQSEREERQDAREAQVDADDKRVREIIGQKAPGVDESIKMYNDNHGYGGVGQHSGMKIEKIPLQDGTTYLAFKDKDGNVVKGQQYTDEQLLDEANKWHSRHVWTQLANVNSDWYMKARQAGMQDDQLRMLHEKFDWEKDKDTRDAKFNETKHADDVRLREQGLRNQAAQLAQGKKQLVPVYDKVTGEQRMVMVDTGAMKSGDTLQTPNGTTLNKPVDKTDERMKQVATEYKQVTDELEFLMKNKREGEVFKFGKDDPENQDNARIDHLRQKAQALNDQMTALRMAQYLPKNGEQAKPAEGLPKSPPKRVSAEITPNEIEAARLSRDNAEKVREQRLLAEREKRKQAIAAQEAQAGLVNGMYAR